MFVSIPEFQFHVPEPLGVPGACYSRAMALSTNAAWFVLTLRMPQPEAPFETFLLAWDLDVVNVIKTSRAQVESLLFVSPRWHGDQQGWITKHIAEVWDATDSQSEDEHCVLMVTNDGQEYSGYFMSPVQGVQRRALVAKVRTTARQSHLND
jgi:hypothetical protein